MPGVRPFTEKGFAGFAAPTWWALVGRAGTPEPILRHMHNALARATLECASRAERCRRFLNAEVERWGRVICKNNITVES